MCLGEDIFSTQVLMDTFSVIKGLMGIHLISSKIFVSENIYSFHEF